MNYYNEIKNRLIDNEIYQKVKDYSKERNKVITYYEIGKLLNEAGGKYGDKIIEEYSKRLMVEVGKKYNRRTLYRMRQFYVMFNNEKVSPVVTQLTSDEKVSTVLTQSNDRKKVSPLATQLADLQNWAPLGTNLSWSHYLLLFPLNDKNMVYYYIDQVKKRNLSVRQLDEIIKNKEYERLPFETKNKIVFYDKVDVKDLVPNPILIKNRNNIEITSEKSLHYLILEDIESFMKELGNSYSFIGSEYKIIIGDRNHYVDLLLFNIKYNCYVVVELKVTKFKADYISQVQKYMNYIDKNIKEYFNNETIGILICKRENKFVIEYCSDERIIVREYKIV